MSEPILHPPPDRLQAYVEGSLDEADRAVLDSHLLVCPNCHGEIEQWRTLFATLATLPQFSPALGFVERVMAGVHVRQPWAARVAEFLRRLVPNTTAGWAAATAGSIPCPFVWLAIERRLRGLRCYSRPAGPGPRKRSLISRSGVSGWRPRQASLKATTA